MKTNLKAAVKLSLILALFAVIASLGGLVLSDLYGDSVVEEEYMGYYSGSNDYV
ncbi:MAG: hypothetical protein ACQES4_11740 [Bacillota bacterium]